jgi:tetratricopeptide (TPR) repeat protein
MKNILFIILLVCTASYAQKSDFDQANDLYRAGKYAEAANLYENILSTKKHSAELYFNLGNAYYKQTKVGPAIYYYEKALLLSPQDDEIITNLEFARKLQIDEVKTVPAVGFNKMIQSITSVFTYDTWAIMAIVCAFGVFLFFAGYYFAGRSLLKRIMFSGMFIFITLVVISVLAAVFEKEVYAEERPAIIFKDLLVVKAEPTADAPDAFTLHEGTKVYITEELENWRKIMLSDNSKGWVEAAAIREIK